MMRDELISKIEEALNKEPYNYLNMARTMAEAALSAIESAGVTLCPNEPTQEMNNHGANYLPMTPGGATPKTAADVYEAMLSASPLKQGREG